MGLVECITRKFFHQIENFVGQIRGNVAFPGALQKLLSHLGHFFGFLLTHGTPEQICLAKGETGQHLRNLHHLLLIQDDAVRALQHSVQRGMGKADRLFAMFAVDVVVHRP